MTGENRTLVDGATTRRSATELRPQLAPGARVERACLAFQASALTATASLADLVEERRIELRLLGCRPSVLPLSLPPLNWSRRLESNQLMRAYQTRARPVSFAEWSRLPESNWLHRGTRPAHRRQCLGDKKMEPALGIEPRSRALPCAGSPVELHRPGGQCGSRTRFSTLRMSRITINAYRPWSE